MSEINDSVLTAPAPSVPPLTREDLKTAYGVFRVESEIVVDARLELLLSCVRSKQGLPAVAWIIADPNR
jgi:hypothetical protein